ncbi:hypothetical protein BVY03_01665 [bacterium K02(2017)]|nr:hypothetical protein BVY03_01665 [bacterium K02(2017)]
MFRVILSFLVMVLFVFSLLGVQNVKADEKSDLVIASKSNVQKVLSLIEVLKPSDTNISADNTKIQKIADKNGGIRQKLDVVIDKDTYVINGCLNCEFNFSVSAPTTILAYGGPHTYKVTKTKPFEGDALIVHTGWSKDNVYNDVKHMTIDEYRAATKK